MRLIRKGAEANLYRDGDKLLKQRIAKGYRAPSLDERIRKSRTKSEAKLLQKARDAGVFAPKVLRTEKFDLTIDYIDGPRVKDELDKKNFKGICEKIGKAIGTMHSSDIIHGDLTTSNMILYGGHVYFIDFGLGFISPSVEDKAVDLHLISEALESTHHEIATEAFETVLNGYKKTYAKAKEVVKRMMVVESRGRYVKRK